MKKIIVSVFLIVLSLLTFTKVNANEENQQERYYTALPNITETSFTNYGYLCEMQKEVTTLNSADDNNSLKIVKNASTEFSIASVYYQKLGEKIVALGETEYVGMKLTVYNETIVPNSGVLFKYNGFEITNVEAYTPEDDLLSTRNLDYEGFRTYVIPFESVDPITIGEFQIGIWGLDAATIYISKMELVHSTPIIDENPTVPEPTVPIEPEPSPRPNYSYLVSGLNDNEEISKFGISATAGTNYNITLNENVDYIVEGSGSLNYTWNHNQSAFTYSEIYIDVEALIQTFVESDLKGISLDLFNLNVQPSGQVGFWIKIAEADGSEYEANYEQIEGGTALDFEGHRNVYIPFTALTNLQSYTQDENGKLDIEQIKIIKFGFWSNTPEAVDVNLYVDNINLLADSEMVFEEEPTIPTPEPVPTPGPSVEFEKAPAYSYLLSGFETEDLNYWGISGTSGTIYKTSLETTKTYVKQGNSSLHYEWNNELYSFGYTEIYMNVSDYIGLFIDCDLKGISFWLYVGEEETIGEVGFWLKAAEKDGSEYEASYLLIEGGTGLGSTGWRKVYVPFSSFTVEQTYAIDENGKLDIDQLAFIKFGLWANQPDLVSVDIYIDDLRLMAEKEMVEPTIPNNPNGPSNHNNKDSNDEGSNIGLVIGIICGCVAVVAGVTVTLVITKKKKTSK